MNKRVRELRKKLNLTMETFGDFLGVKKSAISLIETGRNNLTDQMIKSICREFNVNEGWLRSGAGEMFLPKPKDVIDKLAKQYNLSEEHIVMVERFVSLPEESKNAILDYMKQVVETLEKNKNMTEEEMKNILTTIPDDL